MDELRIQIWDLLYLETKPMTLDEIAQRIGSDRVATGVAVNHTWFECSADQVSIAFGAKSGSTQVFDNRLS